MDTDGCKDELGTDGWEDGWNDRYTDGGMDKYRWMEK